MMFWMEPITYWKCYWVRLNLNDDDIHISDQKTDDNSEIREINFNKENMIQKQQLKRGIIKITMKKSMKKFNWKNVIIIEIWNLIIMSLLFGIW